MRVGDRLGARRFVPAVAFVCLAPAFAAHGVERGVRSQATERARLVRFEPEVRFPEEVDSNSPSYWNDARELVLFTSVGHPAFSVGRDLASLTPVGDVLLDSALPGGKWLEAVVRADDRTLYGYYHNEPPGICPDSDLTAPQIGAAVSSDDGQSWRDLGIILTARPGFLHCDTPNTYFAGGVGDFSVMLDRSREYLYILFTTYAGVPGEQGVTVARLPWSERDRPVGKVLKYFDGAWSEPGLEGAATAIFPAMPLWEDAETDGYWGPSLHWNTSLQQYVMLLNRTLGSTWVNEGIYVSFAPTLDDPDRWSEAQKILDGGDWYPQVVGLEHGHGTDRVAGKEAWFFLHGRSSFRIVFETGPSASNGVVSTARAGVVTGAASSAPIPRAPSPTQPRRRRG